MKHMMASLIVLIASVGAGQAQTLQEIERRDAAVVEAWNAAPLAVQHVVFVAQHPDGFGQYVARPDNVFKPGEKLVSYAEPVGYAWKDIGNSQYQFGFAVDFLIKTPTGQILAGQQDFANLSEKSHARNREFMLTLTMTLTGAAAGDYVLEYKLRDVASSKSVTFDQPFKIAE